MKKLSKDKRNQLILIAMGTVGVMAGLWYFLISFQESKQAEIAKKIAGVQQEIQKTTKGVREADQVRAAFKESTDRLTAIEDTMPSGDLYSLLVSRLKQFNVPSFHVDIPQFGLPSVGEVPMPEFPYHQATVSITGVAYYWDLGKFIAEFENKFPYSRIQNISLDPGGGATSDEREKLTFHFDIVTLVKTT